MSQMKDKTRKGIIIKRCESGESKTFSIIEPTEMESEYLVPVIKEENIFVAPFRPKCKLNKGSLYRFMITVILLFLVCLISLIA